MGLVRRIVLLLGSIRLDIYYVRGCLYANTVAYLLHQLFENFFLWKLKRISVRMIKINTNDIILWVVLPYNMIYKMVTY